jgi:hypothetical protein
MHVPNCYLCNRQDGLQFIGTILDAGTTNTRGQGYTYMLGAQNGMAFTAYNSTNVSGLAQRFAHPAVPGNPTPWKMLGWWLVILFVWIFVEAIPFSDSWVTGLITVFPSAFFVSGILAFGLTLLIGYLGRKTNRAKRWLYAVNTLRNSLYCSWCDVAFSRDAVAIPEEFVQHVFYNNVPYEYHEIAR